MKFHGTLRILDISINNLLNNFICVVFVNVCFNRLLYVVSTLYNINEPRVQYVFNCNGFCEN